MAVATIRLRTPSSPHDWQEARRLVKEYAASLTVDLCFQNFDHELSHFEEEYGPPDGAFFLAERSLGCGGMRRFAEGVAEMKRLYVVPAARGKGVGDALARRIIVEARGLGYRKLVLDTLPQMKAAQALYRELGFREIAAYRHNPVGGTLYFELTL